MKMKVQKSNIFGTVSIPGSKSHTIRALFIASLADGKSEIINPLISDDALSAVRVCRAMGAKIEERSKDYIVNGCGGKIKTPKDIIDVGNSGTSLRIAFAMAGLGTEEIRFTGDKQIQTRPMGPLLLALHNLGCVVKSVNNNNMAPVNICGPIKGGVTELNSVSSQFTTALLMACPLAKCASTQINITLLNEKPYVDMTLWWLAKQGIRFDVLENYKTILIPGNQKYKPFKEIIPGDFSSATFFMTLAAISGGEVIMQNLDISDTQGDKAVLGYLEKMGASVACSKNEIKVTGNKLVGCEIDMNATPDALPAMAVVGCFAEGETVLYNVPQARLKETDRISVIRKELLKMGADIKELEDGLVIKKSKLKPAEVLGHDDHRIVMALAIAGLNVEGETVINGSEAVKITFPEFMPLIKKCGGKIGTVI